MNLQEVYRESIYKSGIAILVDKIYGLLQRYMFEFNQVANGTELHVSGSISGDVTEVTRYNRFREAEATVGDGQHSLHARNIAWVMR